MEPRKETTKKKGNRKGRKLSKGALKRLSRSAQDFRLW